MKRRAMKLVLFLLTGAIINIGVAWGCALVPRNPNYTNMIVVQHGDPVEKAAIERELAWYSEQRPAHFAAEPFVVSSGGNFYKDHLMAQAPGTRSFPRRGSTMNFFAVRVCTGWPMRSLELSHWSDVDRSEDEWRNAFAPLKRLKSGSHYRIPLKPIWPGYAVNTTFYAAVLWAVVAAPGAIRWRMRMKRGRCASCGYSLRENVTEKCPECGTGV